MFLLFWFSIVSSFLVVFSHSPFFGIIGLVILFSLVCSMICYFGFSFMGLMLLLTYLGGMVVVMIFSNALASEKYPNVGRSFFFFFSLFSILSFFFFLSYGVDKGLEHSGSWSSMLKSLDLGGCGLIFTKFYFLLFLLGLLLLVVLCLVLVISFGNSASLRALKKV